MRIATWIVLFIAISWGSISWGTLSWGTEKDDKPADGLYSISKDESAPEVVTQDGEAVRLGKPWDVEILRIELNSNEKKNKSFTLTVSFPTDLDPEKYPPKPSGKSRPKPPVSDKVLLVKGKAYLMGRGFGMGGSGGSDGKERKSITVYFTIRGLDRAKEVGAHFGIEPFCYKHPGYLFNISFTPSKKAYLIGEEVWVTFQVDNLGEEVVAFIQLIGDYSGERNNQFTFCARHYGKQIEDMKIIDSRGGRVGRRVLKPGETFEEKVKLNDWFTLLEPGRYEVIGSYKMEFVDPQVDEMTLFTMNPYIWKDYATARFHFDVKQG